MDVFRGSHPFKEIDMNRILFAELDLPLINKAEIIKWVDGVPEDYWCFDTYRRCYMLPLMTKTGGRKKADAQQYDVHDKEGCFSWTHCAPDLIKEYFEKNIFNWTKEKSRIILLKTPPGGQNPVHIDCSPKAFHTIQHKLRIVVQGASDSLYFKTRRGRIQAPAVEKPFIIDGSWPHGMINNSKLHKYTLCFGSPWTQSNWYPKFGAFISISRSELPELNDKYFNPVYTKDS